MTYANKLTITTLLTLGLGGVLAQSAGCVLVGIEPDEIDVADDEAGTDDASTAGEDEIGGTGDTGADTGNDGTTDVGTTDGGTDTTGDGDTTTGTSDTGTTGDTGTDDAGTETGGDGTGTSDTGTTGAEDPCNFGVDGSLDEGDHEVELLDVASAFESECGGATGPERVYTFSSPAGGLFDISLDSANFAPVLYTIANDCEEPATNCSADNPATVQVDLAPDEVVYIVVDSDGGAGLGSLSITPAP